MEMGKCGPCVLGEGLPPVSTRLINQIWRGEFVDMADLLQDNLEAEWRRGRDDGEPSGQSSRPTRRKVPDMLSWAQCFCTYAVVVAEKQPGRVRQLLAYQATMLREARRCGGQDWWAYDAMFHQLAAAEPSTDWSQLNLFTIRKHLPGPRGEGWKILSFMHGLGPYNRRMYVGPSTAKDNEVGTSRGGERGAPGGHIGSGSSSKRPAGSPEVGPNMLRLE